MNAHDPGLPPAFGRVDRAGLLVHAEPRLAELNRRAGGGVGLPIAVPPIATLVRLAQRLGIAVSRAVVVADGEDDVELWARVEPDAEGARLEVGGWQARDPWPAETDGEGHPDFLRADADWLWETDAALHLTFVSEGAGPAHGFDAASVLGQPLTQLFVLGDGAGTLPMLRAVAVQARFDGQEAAIRGTDRRVRLAAVPRLDGAGRFAGFHGAAHDLPVSATVAEPAEDRLPPVFGERIGRALRDPLGRIIANADSISAQAEGPLGQDYTGYAADIAAAGRHLMALVEDLEDLSAIERPEFTVAAEPLDLADVARRAAGLLAVRAGRGEVRIDRPGLDDHLPAVGEFRRALQILVNLVGNAVRYSPPGAQVWIRLERDGARACVIVADQGKGIAAEDHARIFEKFARVDPSEAGGSGLGLYIARRLARAMGGDISVDSAPGLGARFVFCLPARDVGS